MDNETESVRKIHLGRINEPAEIAYIGIRRAYVFMGFGVNAANSDDIREFHIEHDGPQIRSVEDFSDEQIKEAKSAFREWVIGNGFSELLHNYGIFLDQIYTKCLIVEAVREPGKGSSVQKREKKFHRSMSISGKSQALESEFGISGFISPHILGLNNSRNSLVHNNGIVAESHCTENESLSVSWRKLSLGVRESGEDVVKPLVKNMLIEQGGEVLAYFEDVVKTFNVGEKVYLQPTDIHDICMFVKFDVDKVTESYQEYLVRMGVVLNQVDARVEQSK